MSLGTLPMSKYVNDIFKFRTPEFTDKSQFLYNKALDILDHEEQLKRGFLKIKNGNIIKAKVHLTAYNNYSQRNKKHEKNISFMKDDRLSQYKVEENLFKKKLKSKKVNGLNSSNKMESKKFHSMFNASSGFTSNNTSISNQNTAHNSRKNLPIPKYFTMIYKENKKNKRKLSKPDLNSFINDIKATQIKCVIRHKKQMEEIKNITVHNFDRVLRDYFSENCKTNYLTLSPRDQENSYIQSIQNLEKKKKTFPVLSDAIENVEKVATEIEKRKINLCSDISFIKSKFDEMEKKARLYRSPQIVNRKILLKLNNSTSRKTKRPKLLKIPKIKINNVFNNNNQISMNTATSFRSPAKKSLIFKNILNNIEQKNIYINQKLEKLKVN